MTQGAALTVAVKPMRCLVTFVQWWGVLGALPGGSAVGSACPCRRPGCDPLVGKNSWRRRWQPLQYSCLESPMHRGACGLQSTGSQRVKYDLATKQRQQQGCDLDCASAQPNARSVFLGKAARRQPSPMESNWSCHVLISANLLQLDESFNLNCSSS